MDLELTEEQQLIKDMTRGMLAEHSSIEVVRLMSARVEARYEAQR